MESVLCWPTSPGHRAFLGKWLIHPVTLHQRKQIPLSQQVSTANSFLSGGRVGHSVSYYSLSILGFLSGLNFFGFCSCYHSLCEFTLH